MTLAERANLAVHPRRRWPIDTGGVFVLALAVRLALVVTSRGGFTGDYGYDAGVYYTSADALVHGRTPYADFLLLHPPGLTLVLTPFALLGRLTTDTTGFLAANVAFSALGAVNAVLVVLVARRFGLNRRAALLGGCFYAVWLSAAGPEISARLEPLGTFAFLTGVLLLTRTTRRAVLFAGVALGFAVCVKIWWVVPLVVITGWVALGERRPVSRLVGGAAAVLVAVLGPFFAEAPGPMWRMVVADQLGRHSSHTSPIHRVFSLSSLGQFGVGHNAKIAAVVLIGVAAAVAVRAAWRVRAARVVVVVAVAQLLVLLTAPTYFGYYSGFVAAAVALVIAAAAEPPVRRRRVPVPVVPLVVGVAAVAVTATALATGRPVVATPEPLSLGRLASSVRDVRCVMADSPTALIALDSLSRGLADGCPNWVDVSGRTYDVDASPGRHVDRTKDRRWQADVLRYLQSGQALVVIRKATGLSDTTLRTIHGLPVLARSGRLTVYRSR